LPPPKTGRARHREIERYTPPEYLDRVRAVLGDIDLDPASSEIAQETVKAKHYSMRAHAQPGVAWPRLYDMPRFVVLVLSAPSKGHDYP
jgi:hypothetical protein